MDQIKKVCIKYSHFFFIVQMVEKPSFIPFKKSSTFRYNPNLLIKNIPSIITEITIAKYKNSCDEFAFAKADLKPPIKYSKKTSCDSNKAMAVISSKIPKSSTRSATIVPIALLTGIPWLRFTTIALDNSHYVE